MSDEDKQSKTEQPTEKRLSEAKKKGAPPQSRDLTSTVTLLAAVASLCATGPYMFSSLQEVCRSILATVGTTQVTEATAYSLFLKLLGVMGVMLGPFVATVIAAAITINFAQGGISFSGERLFGGFDKLNPLTGFSRLFKPESAMETAKAFIKIGLVAWIAWRIVKQRVEEFPLLVDRDLSEIFTFAGSLSIKLFVQICLVLLVLSFLDMAFVKWRYIQNLKMTKEEVKQEHRESEGDPQVKGRIRKIQYEQAHKRLMKTIPTADVIITNPTHYAVALKYDRERMAAPFVIAKGVDHLALRIREIAKEHKVMLVENRPLARELYAKVKEGEEIPETLYAAVAEVLAYVYSIKGKI